MSGAADSQNPQTTKGISDDTDTSKPAQNGTNSKSGAQAQLEEDDEFEDFPSSEWPDNETEGAKDGQQQGGEGGSSHLWEESWDDDGDDGSFADKLR
ncbi:MAG: hypothetical protein M1831_005843 [Alyxoria varia]|nr:MAG: hypothetical protein M1831_005843 [Alyxoria varia]